MNKKSKKTLKTAFDIPEPNRKEQFLNSLEIRQQKKIPAHIPMYVSAVATAVLVIGVWGGVKNLPYFTPPEVTDQPVYSVQTETDSNNIKTTAVSVTGKSTSSTVSATDTATKSVDRSSTVTTVTENTTETKSEKNTSSGSATGLQTTDVLHENESPTAESTKTQRVTDNATTVRITSVAETTNARTTTARTARTTQQTYTTTTAITQQTTVPDTTYADELQATVPTVSSEEPEPNTGNSGGTVNVPKPIEQDFTVSPPVRYYPSDNAVDIRDMFNSDGMFPPTLDPSLTNSVQDIKSIIKSSDLIVLATVDEVIYTGIDGKPYTQENITVLNTIYGYVPENVKISVYSKGGYIPASEYVPDMHIDLEEFIENDSVIFDPYMNNTTPRENDVYVYLLSTSDGDLPDGSYSLTTLSDISKFRYENGNYINVHNNNLVLSPDELHDYIYN